MLFKVYLLLLFICFIIGVISIYKNRNVPFYLKLVPWFILITFAAEVLDVSSGSVIPTLIDRMLLNITK